jgi:hypothetical protein
VTSTLESSEARWNRGHLDLRSEETLAQILDRGSLDDWRAIYRLAAEDGALRARLRRVVDRVPLGYPSLWRTVLCNLGEEVDLDAPVPEDPGLA